MERKSRLAPRAGRDLGAYFELLLALSLHDAHRYDVRNGRA